MKAALKKAWEFSGWLVAAYAVYNQLSTMNKMKNELYTQLTPDEQAIWDKIAKVPKAVAASTTAYVESVVPKTIATDIEKLQISS